MFLGLSLFDEAVSQAVADDGKHWSQTLIFETIKMGIRKETRAIFICFVHKQNIYIHVSGIFYYISRANPTHLYSDSDFKVLTHIH